MCLYSGEVRGTCQTHSCRHTCRVTVNKHRTPHLELLSLLERKASLTDLLTPVASLVRVADHHFHISMCIETWVDMQGDILVIWANIQCKTAARCHKRVFYISSHVLTFNMGKSIFKCTN